MYISLFEMYRKMLGKKSEFGVQIEKWKAS